MSSELKENPSGMSLLDSFIELRDTFSEEIPNEILSSTSPNNRFKVRKSWIQMVLINLDLGLFTVKIHNPKLVKAANAFIEKYSSEEFGKQPRVTAENIQEGNKIIDLVLKSL